MNTIIRTPLLIGAQTLTAAIAFGGLTPANASSAIYGDRTAAMDVVTVDQDAVINTGSLTNTGYYGFGLVAEMIDETYCGTLTINVTGDILTGADGVRALGCGQSTVNVLAGTSMTRTHGGWPTLRNTGRNITTNIEGLVAAQTASYFVLDNWVGDSPADNPTGTATLNVGSAAQLIGYIHMTVGSDLMTISPGGQWTTANVNYFHEGNDTLTNRGIIFAQAGAAFQDLENFENFGTVDLSDGQIATLNISGDYLGNSSQLKVEVSGSVADQLVIGGAASGSTSVHVNFLSEGVFSSEGMRLIDAGTSSPDAFHLGSVSGNVSSLVDYKLTQQGSDYILEATPNEIALQPMSLRMVAQDLSHQSADSVSRGIVRSPRVRRKTPFAIWSSSRGETDPSAQLHNAQGGAVAGAGKLESQFGADVLLQSNLIIGVSGSYGKVKAKPRLVSEGIKADNSNFGMYAQLAGEKGLYAIALLKKDTQTLQLADNVFRKVDGKGSSVGLHLEGGRRWHQGSTGLALLAGLSLVRTRIDSFGAEGITYKFDGTNSLRGRIATSVEFAGDFAPFINAEIQHEFAGDSRMKLISGGEAFSADSAGRATWARFEMGFGNRGDSRARLSAWGQIGKEEAVGLRAALHFGTAPSGRD